MEDSITQPLTMTLRTQETQFDASLFTTSICQQASLTKMKLLRSLRDKK